MLAKFQNNFLIFFSFCSSFLLLLRFTHCIFAHKMRTHTPIKLIYIKGLLKHISVPILDKDLQSYDQFLHKRRLKVCHAYRVNCWKELVETWHVDGVTIVGVPFCGFKDSENDHGDIMQNPTSVKIM